MNAAQPAVPPFAPAGGPTTSGDQNVYGLVEWDGAYRPTVIVGCCWPALLRDIIAILTGWIAARGAFGSDEFRQQHPIPDPNAPTKVLADWLDALRGDTSVPWVTLMGPEDLVHIGDPLILLNRMDSISCISRPVRLASPGQAAIDHLPAPVPAGPPAVVNGCPVVAAVAETGDATSWIVICRRTQRPPAWAAGTTWYVTWRAWWDGQRWTGENGDYGPHHGLTWPQAQQSLARRLGLPAAQPIADPGVYLQFADDCTDTWNCPTCRQPITEVYDCRTLSALQTAITAHRCTTPPAHPNKNRPTSKEAAVGTPQTRRLVYSHSLLRLSSASGSRWRIGYLAEPAAEEGMFRVSRAVAAQIAADMQALRGRALAAAADAEEFYEDALGAVAGLPRVKMHGEHFVVDRRHISGKYAVRVTDPDPDGLYTIGLDLGWQLVDAAQCDAVRDDTTCPSPVVAAYLAYVNRFTDPASALQDLAERAGIAVAWLDRGAIEAASRPLSDDEWGLLWAELHQYDGHVSATDEVNSVFLDRIFSDAGLDRYRNDAGTTDNTTA